MYMLKIDRYSHYFKVSGFNVKTKHLVIGFAGRMVQLQLTPNPNKQSKKKFVPKPTKLFAGITHDRSEFRFHIEQWDIFFEHLQINGIYEKEIQIIDHKPVAGTDVVFKAVDERKPRDYQVPQIEYLEKEQTIKVLTAQTGRGKTFMALTAIRTLGKRTLLTLTKDTYISKWKDDVVEAYGLKPGEVIIVKGKDALAGLIELAKRKEIEDIKFIICSSKTLAMFIDAYEKQDKEALKEYGCNPDKMYELLGIGVKLIDESHEHVHSTYRQFMYTHVAQSISLSATLINDSNFISKVIDTMYPHYLRPEPTAYDKYIDVYNCLYSINPEHRRSINYIQRGMGSYSHVALEASIMKDRRLFENYMTIMESIIEELYLKKRNEGKKLLIFASTIKMCNLIVEYFSRKYPKENIAKYTADDDYETLLNTTWIVSTLGSAGTGVDVPDLMVAISSVAVGSKVQNIQSLGRLRRLSDDTVPIFAYMSCVDIPNHLEYHQKKVGLFADKTNQHLEIDTNLSL